MRKNLLLFLILNVVIFSSNYSMVNRSFCPYQVMFEKSFSLWREAIRSGNLNEVKNIRAELDINDLSSDSDFLYKLT